jgi:hypothetical protein
VARSCLRSGRTVLVPIHRCCSAVNTRTTRSRARGRCSDSDAERAPGAIA